MMKRQFSLFSLVFAVIFCMTSCGGGSSTSESEKETEASEEFDAAKTEIISDIDKMIKDLPPPSEVPYLLMATGSDFDPTVVNSLDKLDSYATPSSKAALNLGVYTTDVGYLASYEKAQLSLDYVSACQKLAEDLGIASAMDIELIGRFERNINNKDSLKILVDEVIARTGDRLDAMDRMSVVGLVLAGTYIEGLYISNILIQNYPNDLPEETRTLILEPMIKIVIDQKVALDDLMNVLNKLDESQDIQNVKTDLMKIKEVYEGELTEVSNAISENTGDLVLQPSVLSNLHKEVTAIRAKVVE